MRYNPLWLAVAAAVSAPVTSHAVKYKLSGQVNRAVAFYDDGFDSQVRSVDNDYSGTRFRFKGSEDLGNGLKVGFYWELQTSSNPSKRQNAQLNGDTQQGGGAGAQLRQANVWFSGGWGKLTLGQGNGAGKEAVRVDLSGTGVVQGHYMTSYTAGLQWRTSGGGVSTAAATEGASWSEFDAFGRYDQIRYDTPALGPVALAASVGNANRFEVAGRLNTGLGGGRLSAALFYGQDHGRSATDNTRFGGSASYLFSQGTSITGAWGFQEQDVTGGQDSDTFTVKLGHKWGPHAVSATFGIADEVGGRDVEHTAFGAAYAHSLKKANTQLYAAFQFSELDLPAGVASVEEHYLAIMGARVKFD